MNYEHGRILAVNETRLGSELVSAHAAGVMSLTVEDPVDFDEDGGWLKIADQVIEYSTYDDDTGEITLLTALAAAAEDGDRVFVWDQLRQVITTDKIAQVELDGDDANTDPLEATIPLHLLDDLEEGIRGTTGESVLLEQDGDEWRIVDVLGLAAPGGSGVQFWDKDTFAVTTAGEQALTLTHTPIEGSLHVILFDGWRTLEYDEFTVDGKTVTIPDPDGWIAPGENVDTKYAYRAGITSESVATEWVRVPDTCPHIQPWTIYAEDTTRVSGGYIARPYTFGVKVKIDTRSMAAWPVLRRAADGVIYLGDYKGGRPGFDLYAFGAADAEGVRWKSYEYTWLSTETEPELLGFMLWFDTATDDMTQLPPLGAMGTTDPAACRWYFGTKVADTADDTDEPAWYVGLEPPA